MDWLGEFIEEMLNEEQYDRSEELVEIAALSILADGKINHDQLDEAIEIFRNHPNPAFSPSTFIEKLQDTLEHWQDKPEERIGAFRKYLEKIAENGQEEDADMIFRIFDADGGGNLAPEEAGALLKLAGTLWKKH